MKTYDVASYRNCCIRHNFFTGGTNTQYMRAFGFIEKGVTLHDLSIITFMCTSGYTLEEIQGILKKEVFKS